MSNEKSEDPREIATAQEVLDFLVKAGHINYSKPDNVYFYWKDGNIVFLNFKLK